MRKKRKLNNYFSLAYYYASDYLLVVSLFKTICYILCFVFLSPFCAFANEIELSAQSAIAIDAYTKTVLYEKNANAERAIASTTKIMTCLLACESNRLDEVVVINKNMLNGCEGSMIYLSSGDRITLYDLVCGAMIASGNDAANAIAFFLAGSAKSFAKMMNDRALTLGMNSTKFVTPSGLDKGGNHSTAYDMALLSAFALQNKTLMGIASMKSAQISINNKKQTIYNHNKLLSYSEDFIGLKTGYTKKAGRCLVSAYKYGGSIIICVTLNADDDWQDHKTLVNYTKKCYKDIYKGEKLKISVVGGEKDSVECFGSYNAKAVSNVEYKRYYYPFVYAPIKVGDVLGKEELYINNVLIESTQLKAEEDINQWQITK